MKKFNPFVLLALAALLFVATKCAMGAELSFVLGHSVIDGWKPRGEVIGERSPLIGIRADLGKRWYVGGEWSRSLGPTVNGGIRFNFFKNQPVGLRLGLGGSLHTEHDIVRGASYDLWLEAHGRWLAGGFKHNSNGSFVCDQWLPCIKGNDPNDGANFLYLRIPIRRGSQ